MIKKESVRVSVTMSKSLHSKIVAIAEEEDRSVAGAIKVLVEYAIKNRN